MKKSTLQGSNSNINYSHLTNCGVLNSILFLCVQNYFSIIRIVQNELPMHIRGNI